MPSRQVNDEGIRRTIIHSPEFEMSVHQTTDPATLQAYPARYLAAWSQRDIDTALDVVATQLHWVDPSLPAPMTTRDEARAFFTASWQGFPDLTMQAVGSPLVDAARGRVAQEWRMTGTHTGEGFPPGVPPTGKAFDVSGTDVWELDQNGRAVSIHAYWDVTTLMNQLGLV
jgi:steroid delta-isomerase-like uncharacterized protein